MEITLKIKQEPRYDLRQDVRCSQEDRLLTVSAGVFESNVSWILMEQSWEAYNPIIVVVAVVVVIIIVIITIIFACYLLLTYAGSTSMYFSDPLIFVDRPALLKRFRIKGLK